MPRYKPCVVQQYKRQHGEKRHVLDRELQIQGLISLFPPTGGVSLGKPFNLSISYLSNQMIGQDVSTFPLLKVIIYNNSPSWSLWEHRGSQRNAYLPLVPWFSGCLLFWGDDMLLNHGCYTNWLEYPILSQWQTTGLGEKRVPETGIQASCKFQWPLLRRKFSFFCLLKGGSLE